MHFYLDTPLANALRQLLLGLAEKNEMTMRVTAYLAGGMAMHLYTGVRVTTDVDAEFTVPIFVPPSLAATAVMEDGVPVEVVIDTNFNPMFALLHENYQVDAIPVDIGVEHFDLRVLTPIDLALSKIARFAPVDRDDICTLARDGLITEEALERRAAEALGAQVGGGAMLRHNVRDALEIVRSAKLGFTRG